MRHELERSAVPGTEPPPMPATSLAGKPSLMRWLILVDVFSGDPERWRSFLGERGSPRQVAEDLPFVEQLCGMRRDDPRRFSEMVRLVSGVSGSMMPARSATEQ